MFDGINSSKCLMLNKADLQYHLKIFISSKNIHEFFNAGRRRRRCSFFFKYYFQILSLTQITINKGVLIRQFLFLTYLN